MRIITNLLVTSVLITLVIFEISCGTQEQTTKTPQMQTIEKPCFGDDFLPKMGYFRASGIGESRDQSISRQKALTKARAELATSMGATMKKVEDNFINSIEAKDKEEIQSIFSSKIRTIVQQSLPSSIIACEKVKFNPENNKYITYVNVEVSINQMEIDIKSTLSKSEELNRNENYQRIQESLNQELKQFK